MKTVPSKSGKEAISKAKQGQAADSFALCLLAVSIFAALSPKEEKMFAGPETFVPRTPCLDGPAAPAIKDASEKAPVAAVRA
jgi:hypothetical protein